MKTFKELLLERQLKTKEDIQKAISEWSSLPKAKQASEAKRIIKASKEIGYIIKQQGILAYVEEENKQLEKWFGKSKVVNERGEPLKVYHGSNSKNIKEFDISKIGKNTGNYGHYGFGIYFSDDIREAKTYGKTIYECYVKIENPFYGNKKQLLELKKAGVDVKSDIIKVSINFESFKNQFKDSKLLFYFLENIKKFNLQKAWEIILENKPSDEILDKLNLIHGIIEYTDINENVNGVPEHILQDIKELGIKPKFNYDFEFDISLHWITNLGEKSKEITEVIKSLGYDGVIYGSEIIPFNSNQIKINKVLMT